VCWGSDQFKQLGEQPVAVRDTTEVATGGAHTCAIKSKGAVTFGCWGLNNNGQVTRPNGIETGVVKLALGSEHTCIVVMNTGTDGNGYKGYLHCWGNDTEKQCQVPPRIDISK